MLDKFWQIKNEADSAEAELLLYGEIADTTWWGDEVTPKQFADDLKELGGKNLVVRVNSPGGDVFAAQAIYSQLKAYAGHITMRIDGLAASAATIITCAGDTVIMPDNALFMIHNPKGGLIGYYDAKALADYAKQLDTIRQTIINVYSKRVGNNLTETQLKHKMDDETWLTAQEALDYGFIDQIDSEAEVKNSLKDGMLVMNTVTCDLSRFKHGDTVEKIMNQIIAQKAKKDREKEVKSVEKDLLKKIKDILGMKPADMASQVSGSDNAKVDNEVVAERERMLALDALDDHTSEAVTKLINVAKENGSTVEQVRPFIDVIREETAQITEQATVLDAINALIKDEMESGAMNISPSVPADTPADAKKAAIDEIVNIANGN